MPPLRQPTNLQSLALNASVKLLVAFCSNVDKTCSENVNCPHQASHKPSAFCRQCCQIDVVQRVIFKSVAPTLWDTIVEAAESFVINIAESFHLQDYRILYAFFIHPNMRKFKSKILAVNSIQTRSDFNIHRAKNSLGGISCTDFWLEQIPYFTNMRTLNLTFLLNEATEIFRLVGTVCAELEEISFNTDNISQTFQLLVSCQKLRSITYKILTKFPRDLHYGIGFEPWHVSSNRHVGCKLALELFPNLELLRDGWSNYEMSNLITSLDPSTRLNLRHLYVTKRTLHGFRRIVTICPRFDSLDIDFDTPDNCSDFMSFLSASPLVITELLITAHHSVNMNNPAVHEYFTTKGCHLHKLTLRYVFSHRTLCVIAKNCSNLVELTMNKRFSYYSDYSLENAPLSVLTRLRKITCTVAWPGGMEQCKRTLSTLLPSNSGLSELDITVFGHNHEPGLKCLGDSYWFANLSRLTVRGRRVSGEVVRHLYEKGEILTELCILRSKEAWTSVESIRKEVKENNLQFNIVLL